jgi:hypothetical protein
MNIDITYQDFKMVDLLDATEVEFHVDVTGKCWLNLNGKCLLRVGRARHIAIIDDREVKGPDQ